MSAIKPEVQPKPRKKSTKLTTCSRCNEAFDADKRQAKCLPCLHSFCAACLHEHIDGKESFNCPTCDKHVVTPDGTVESLQDNFLVQNVKGHKDIFKENVDCGNCSEEGNHSVGYCHDCACFQCQNCMDNHLKMKALSHHNLSSISELKEKKFNPQVQNVCKQHPMQSLTLYCRDRPCRVPVCASCGHTNHRAHDLIDMTAAADEIRADMRILTTQVNKKNQELGRMRAILDKAEQTLTDNFNQKQKDMYESVQQVYALIDSRYKDAQNNLKELFETENDRLEGNFKTIDSLSAQMSSACDFAEDACDIGQPTQLLAAQTQIIARLRELEKMSLPENVAHNFDLQYTSKHHSAVQQIQDLLQHLYDVNVPDSKDSSKPQRPLIKAPAPPPATSSKPVPIIPQRVPKADPTKSIVQMKKKSDKTWYLRGIIQTVDFNGKKLSTGGANFRAEMDDGQLLPVQDNQDGTYFFDYESANYGSLIYLKLDGQPLNEGNPYKG